MEFFRAAGEVLLGNALYQHYKFISADTIAAVHAERSAELFRKADYKLVAELVTAGVVGEFQTVHVCKERRENAAVEENA